MKIEIIYEISPTYREIYEFEICMKRVKYVGIYYSRRNDEDDLWGDLWSATHKEKRTAEEKVVEDKHENYCSCEYCRYCRDFDQEMAKIRIKYNPIENKTKEGKPYYSGTSFGGEKGPEIKMPIKELKTAIRNELTKGLKFYF